VFGSLGTASPLSAQTGPAASIDGPPPPAPPEVVARDGSGHITMRAVRLNAPLVVDGRLDEEAYLTIPAVGDFIQQEPKEGAPATEKTDLWIFFDAHNLYVAARCWETKPERAVANEKRRDNQNIQDGDSLTILLDTFYDRRTGYFLQTNPIGAVRDSQIADERNANADWNTVWDTKVHRDDKGWTVEMVIPFKSLRYSAGSEQVWGLNVRRIVRWKNEVSYLSPVPIAAGGRGVFKMSSAGSLVGISLTGESRNLEVKPYLKSGLTTNLQTRPVVSNDPSADIGVDVKYGVTKGLTADFTVNTDFAQSEQDEQQVNLTRFSLFFPEKREFFLEGQGIFAFAGVQSTVSGNAYAAIQPSTQAPPLTPIMFFSRQIGLNGGQEVPIRAGARMTGHVGAYSVGLLNIQTGALPAAGIEGTNSSVVRIKRDILRRSAIGVIGTLRPKPGDAGSNGLYGADATFALFDNLTINSYYARTHTPGITTDPSSHLAKVDYAGDRYGLNVEHLKVGEGFNPEIGFLYRQAFQRNFGLARFSPRPRSSRTIRKLTWEGSLDYITNPDGRLDSRDATAAFRMD
jgi:hypothetical protein